MKAIFALVICCLVMLAGCASKPPLAPSTQARLDEQKAIIKEWAAQPEIIAAVQAQNKKGPVPGLTNPKWQALSPNDPLVQYIARNPTSLFLKEKVASSHGLIAEAFISAQQGEKVAFASKPSNYTHHGALKFELPMTGQQWQGEPAFDESSQTRTIQIATPVFDQTTPIGVILIGISIDKLQAE